MGQSSLPESAITVFQYTFICCNYHYRSYSESINSCKQHRYYSQEIKCNLLRPQKIGKFYQPQILIRKYLRTVCQIPKVTNYNE